MNHIGVAVCLLLVASAASEVSGVWDASGPITVRIVPTSFSEKGGRAITLSHPSQHFHVVLTNVSKEPIRLWREWCSWGYFTLFFEATDESGKTVNVRKKPKEWNKNYPDWTIIPAGDHMVFDVTFEESTWQNAPLPEREKSRTARLKAIFEIPEDVEAKGQKVWTGRVSSPEYTYTFYR